ncbi:unnamed protein product [Nesidiocoris tenuis]|uniref:Uncharacterized protein n=1 Tax=Nesidiocoris tenuis TaxID=355587 RepID=A0A6H5HVJ8_9HEMI|nr:unnamed protein product [Nesidiocoris tenuis]
MLMQCIDSLVQKVQSGVVINFEKIGPDPPPVNNEGFRAEFVQKSGRRSSVRIFESLDEPELRQFVRDALQLPRAPSVARRIVQGPPAKDATGMADQFFQLPEDHARLLCWHKFQSLRDQLNEFGGFVVGVGHRKHRASQSYRNAFDIPRNNLLDQILRMRANFLNPSPSHTKLQDDASGLLQRMMVDEADIDLVGGPSSLGRGQKRTLDGTNPSRPNKRKPGPIPRDVTIQRPLTPASPLGPLSPSSPLRPLSPSPPASPTPLQLILDESPPASPTPATSAAPPALPAASTAPSTVFKSIPRVTPPVFVSSLAIRILGISCILESRCFKFESNLMIACEFPGTSAACRGVSASDAGRTSSARRIAPSVTSPRGSPCPTCTPMSIPTSTSQRRY